MAPFFCTACKAKFRSREGTQQHIRDKHNNKKGMVGEFATRRLYHKRADAAVNILIQLEHSEQINRAIEILSGVWDPEL